MIKKLLLPLLIFCSTITFASEEKNGLDWHGLEQTVTTSYQHLKKLEWFMGKSGNGSRIYTVTSADLDSNLLLSALLYDEVAKLQLEINLVRPEALSSLHTGNKNEDLLITLREITRLLSEVKWRLISDDVPLPAHSHIFDLANTRPENQHALLANELIMLTRSTDLLLNERIAPKHVYKETLWTHRILMSACQYFNIQCEGSNLESLYGASPSRVFMEKMKIQEAIHKLKTGSTSDRNINFEMVQEAEHNHSILPIDVLLITKFNRLLLTQTLDTLTDGKITMPKEPRYTGRKFPYEVLDITRKVSRNISNLQQR